VSRDPLAHSVAWGHDEIQEVEHKVWLRCFGVIIEAGSEYNPCLGVSEYIIRLTRL
jgi:hypothetical protein